MIATRSRPSLKRAQHSKKQVKPEDFAPIGLGEFIKQAWHVVEPAIELKYNWHIDAVAEHLEAVTRGQISNLIINIPPGCMKSLSGCVFWPAWVWGEIDPSTRWLFSSYAQSLAVRDSKKCRRVIRSFWYQARYGHQFQITQDEDDTKIKFENNKTGFRLSSSVGGVGTGERADFIVTDDPIKVGDANSETKRARAVDWWLNEMSTRGTNPNTAHKVIIMQRLHELDPSGAAEALGTYEVLRLPMEFEPERRCVTSIGWTDPRTRPMEKLFPALFGEKVLLDARRSLGEYGYAGQMQQNPSPAEGGMFKRKNWGLYAKTPKFTRLIMSVDASFKGGKENDFVVIHVWGQHRRNVARNAQDASPFESDYYLLDEWRSQAGITATEQAIKAMAKKWPAAYTKLVENKANGPAIVERLENTIKGIQEYKLGSDSKEARASAIVPIHERGGMLLPIDPAIAPVLAQMERDTITVGEWWELHPPDHRSNDKFIPLRPDLKTTFKEGSQQVKSHGIIDEFAGFPTAANDDRVDASDQCINWSEANQPKDLGWLSRA
jgi:hypothetical protein